MSPHLPSGSREHHGWPFTAHLRRMAGSVLALALLFLPSIAAAQIPPTSAGDGGVPAHDVLLTCVIPPLDPTCQMTLRPGEKAVVLGFHLARVLPTDPDSIALSIGASACCLSRTTVYTDPNGFASVQWTGNTEPSGDVIITVSRREDTDVRSQTITLHPHQAKKPEDLEVDSLELEQTYVWLSGQYVPIPVNIELRAVGSRPLDRKSCESLRYNVSVSQEGKVTPDSGSAIWSGSPETSEGTCLVETHWKLADAAGEQLLEFSVAGDNVRRRRIQVAGIARQGPRIAAGYGYFTSVRREREVTCASVEARPECAELVSFPGTVTIQETRNGGEPYFGLELPLFYRYEVRHGVGRWASEHLRFVIGTTFERPEDNYFIGVALFSLATSAAERSPFQWTVGTVAFRGAYTGISFDAASVVKPILGALGIEGL